MHFRKTFSHTLIKEKKVYLTLMFPSEIVSLSVKQCLSIFSSHSTLRSLSPNIFASCDVTSGFWGSLVGSAASFFWQVSVLICLY